MVMGQYHFSLDYEERQSIYLSSIYSQLFCISSLYLLHDHRAMGAHCILDGFALKRGCVIKVRFTYSVEMI